MAQVKRTIGLKVKRLNNDAVLPAYAHEGDACMDVVVTSVEYDVERDEYIYGTGLSCETTTPVAAFCHPRSSIHKTNFFLTNSVGVVDCKTYRGEIKAIFKHRDSLEMRIAAAAMKVYDELPWYSKLFKGNLTRIMNRLRDEFMENPIKWAPYQVGERAFQMWLCPIRPATITEVDELSNTERGEGGFGSTGKKQLNFEDNEF